MIWGDRFYPGEPSEWVDGLNLTRRIDFDADPVFGLACMDGADTNH
jgi:hypothetical protein